jgi:3D (Asp-Asp-Asp) domain-containing protein
MLAGCTVPIGAAPAPASRPPPVPDASTPDPAPFPLPGRPPATELPVPLELPVAPAAGAMEIVRTLQMRATAYCLGGNMRTGVRVRNGMAAGDPSVLPLGSVVHVSHPDGRPVGIFVIMDTGGAVRGNMLDLWMESCSEARSWGVRNVVAQIVRIGR